MGGGAAVRGPKLDDDQKDLVIIMSLLFGGSSLFIMAIGVSSWLMSLGGCP